MARTAMSRRKKHNSFMGFVLVAMVVFLISVIIFVQGRNVKSRIAAYDTQEMSLNEQLADEEQRGKEIDEYEIESQTKGFAADKARESLGLVQEGEIIFRKNH
ncbi:MAG: septum formation initiator family protein [Lachnospiraceae bacterium]|nr:septum formation initiator family protein [Lachnospiraceae bacterium]MBR6302548.1 septum formation initiator family protein [Lachnospiraceae bacterium]MBR6908799.1 septum formation initiator family protein [Lachnospiraceae bacterium]